MKNSVEILEALELPYHVIEICTGDLADWKYRSADLEVWRPTTNSYGEVMSLSNCTDYQARKLDIKCVDNKGNKLGQLKLEKPIEVVFEGINILNYLPVKKVN